MSLLKTCKTITRSSVLAINNYVMCESRRSVLLKDSNLLESALARPANVEYYMPEATIYDLAAALGEGLAMNHPFFDGNKRTAYMAMAQFLEINGQTYQAPTCRDDAWLMVERLAKAEIEAADMAMMLQEGCSKRDNQHNHEQIPHVPNTWQLTRDAQEGEMIKMPEGDYYHGRVLAAIARLAQTEEEKASLNQSYEHHKFVLASYKYC